ncbi:MAG: TIGR03862 family flavoprotein [Flavobacteriales bacterium]|nr:TIGR03862 family flavoprotein [Flavobacteriales bacterium]
MNQGSDHSVGPRPQVAIVGGGPAGLIAADLLSGKCEVHLYEQGRMVGRKFLVAGDGGLNITNRASGEDLFAQFTPRNFMQPLLEAFGPAELRAWLGGMGVETFVGSSGRVFPVRGIKPAEVLAAIRHRLDERGVNIHHGHTFVGFDEQALPIVEHANGRTTVKAEAVLFALGGASWPKTGSTGAWREHFEAIGVRTVPFTASNCGLEVDLPVNVRPHEGKALKNIMVSSGDRSVRGEATITGHGLEGNAIYPVVPAIREALVSGGPAYLTIDLKPDLSFEQMEFRLRDAAWKERLAALKLDRQAVALYKAFTPLERSLDGRWLAYDIKNLRIPVRALRPVAEAISTVGGISLDEVGPDLALLKHPRFFVAGEMLDTDAPTGGYLLQAAFSMGSRVAMAMLNKLTGRDRD